MTQSLTENQPTKKPLNWHPDTIEWQELAADGTKYSLLEGVKDIPGVAFTYAFFIPAGMWDAPHWHSTDSRIVVLSGELKLGYGKAFEKAEAQTFALGSYLYVPANTVHFDGAEVDTIIIGAAVGTWATSYVEG